MFLENMSTHDTILLGYLVFGIPLFWFLEAKEVRNLGYSKFSHLAKGPKVGGQIGMLIVYSCAPLIYLYFYLAAGRPSTVYHTTLTIAFVGHFAKRLLEVLYVHKYSSSMTLDTVGIIWSSYSLWGYTAGYFVASRTSLYMGKYNGGTWQFSLGLILFVVGELINGYHHLLLAGLRPTKPKTAVVASGSSTTDTSYKLPTGGLFGFLLFPHYTGELLAWFGYALATQYLIPMVFACLMLSYLHGRSIASLAWYEKKFGAAVRQKYRWVLIPYVF